MFSNPFRDENSYRYYTSLDCVVELIFVLPVFEPCKVGVITRVNHLDVEVMTSLRDMAVVIIVGRL